MAATWRGEPARTTVADAIRATLREHIAGAIARQQRVIRVERPLARPADLGTRPPARDLRRPLTAH